MRNLLRPLASLLMLALVLVAAAPATAQGQGAATGGEWSKPFAELPLFATRPPESAEESMRIPPAVSMAVLPDGRVIYWAGLEGLEATEPPFIVASGPLPAASRTRVLDLRGREPVWTKPEQGGARKHDMFCADLRLLANGKLLVAGGTIWYREHDFEPVTGQENGSGDLLGSNAVRTFDYRTGKWQLAKKWMNWGRWYPTLVTLGNGNLLVASGVETLLVNRQGVNVHATETYDLATGKWKDNGDTGATSLPLYARLHLLPDGTVFYPGVGQMWGPFGQAADEALWHIQKAYNPKENAWAPTGVGSFGARSGAFSVLLPLKPPYKEARVLVAGGTLGTSPGTYVAHNLTEIVTVKDGVSESVQGPSLNNPRWFSSGVLLPGGDVVALSGGSRDEVIWPGSETPVRQAELFDGEKWIPLGEATRARTYHNTAVLLADGSVLVGGHAPLNANYGAGGENPWKPVTGSSSFKDPSFEILKPPYLFRGPRPVIASVQEGLAWGRSFDVATPDAREVEKVVLVRLPTTTHTVDADMRSVELPFEVGSSGKLRASVPNNPNVAPPGYYYLFLMSDNGDGLTPSKARVVRVTARESKGEAVAPMGK